MLDSMGFQYFGGRILYASGRTFPITHAEDSAITDPNDGDHWWNFDIPLGETGYSVWLYVYPEGRAHRGDSADAWWMLYNERLEDSADSQLAIRVQFDDDPDVVPAGIYVSTVNARYGGDPVKVLLGSIMEGAGEHHDLEAGVEAEDFIRVYDRLLQLPITVDPVAVFS